MRDYRQQVAGLRGAAKGLREINMPRTAKQMEEAADAIEELFDQRDKALKRLCEFCGICSEKSRTPLECEVAGFVVEPPKEVE